MSDSTIFNEIRKHVELLKNNLDAKGVTRDAETWKELERDTIRIIGQHQDVINEGMVKIFKISLPESGNFSGEFIFFSGNF